MQKYTYVIDEASNVCEVTFDIQVNGEAEQHTVKMQLDRLPYTDLEAFDAYMVKYAVAYVAGRETEKRQVVEVADEIKAKEGKAQSITEAKIEAVLARTEQAIEE